VTASSEETAREPAGVANAIDGNSETIWHTRWGSPALPPHYIKIELPRPAVLSGLRYLPRQDGSANGNATAYEIEVSADGVTWQQAATGTWSTDASRKTADLGFRSARFVRLWGNDPFMAAAEVHMIGSYEPTAPASVTLTPQQSPDMVNWSDLDGTPAFTVPLSNPRQFFRLKIEKP
jgi:galactose oxidase